MTLIEHKRLEYLQTRVTLKWKNKLLYHALYAWRNTIGNIIRQRKKLALAIKRMSKLLLLKTLKYWGNKITKRMLFQKTLTFTLTKKKNMIISSSFQQWNLYSTSLKEYEDEMLYTKKIMTKLFLKYKYKHVSMSFNKWYHEIKLIVKYNVIIKTVTNRMKRKLEVSCFNSWKFNVNEIKYRKYILSSIIGRVKYRKLHMYYKEW